MYKRIWVDTKFFDTSKYNLNKDEKLKFYSRILKEKT